MRRLSLTAIAIVSALALQPVGQAAAAQTIDSTGSMIGRIIDEKTGQPISEATVRVVGIEVVGTTFGARTGIDGRYRIPNLRVGTVTVYVNKIGYTAKTVTGLYVTAGKTIEQDVSLTPGALGLIAMVVSADRERGTVSDALDLQRNAPNFVNSVTRQEMNRNPDGDAAKAAQRVGGIAIGADNSVNARGLGDKYTSVMLGSVRVPSPEPEKKTVPLDLFPSSLLDAISVSKTFTPDQAGDFAGAQVTLKMREFPADRQMTYTVGSGVNMAAGGRSDLPTAPGVGGESFALARASRGLPNMVRSAGDLSHTTPVERNAMINSFRDIWQAGRGGAQPNATMGFSLGGSDPISGHRVGYIASGTYALTQQIHAGESRSLARPNGQLGGVEGYNAFTGTTAGTSVLWGGLLNLSTLVGTHSRLEWNNMYNRTSDNDARVERGTYEDLSIPVTIQRLNYVQRSVWTSQLVGERETESNRLHYTISGSGVRRSQPDRSELVRQIVTDPAGGEKQLWVNTLPEAAARTFADLTEHALESAVDFQHKLGDPADNRSIKFGILGRTVHRDADTRAYGIYSFSMSDDVRALPPEVLFGGQFTSPDSTILSLRSLAQGGSYTAQDYIGAGFGMFDGAISSRFRLIAGARYEYANARVKAISTLNDRTTARRTFNDILPSVAVTYAAAEDQNLRFSLTRTLAPPEYRELAGLRTRDVLGGVDVRGNPDLVRTLIDNADVRWEMYPNRGEILSVGVFYKHFHNPIERVFLASNTNSLVTFLNASGGTDYGLELEARKGLGALDERLSAFTAFSNVTLMRSRVTLGTTATTATNPTRPMAGQAPYIVNAGLTYARSEEGASATLLFNRVGDRITSAGELPLPDVIEQAHSSLDMSLRVPFGRGVTGRFDLKNLLDDAATEMQGPVVREQYRAGRVLQAALSWRP